MKPKSSTWLRPCLAAIPFTILPIFAAFSSQVQVIPPDPVILGRAVFLNIGLYLLVFWLLTRFGHPPQVVFAAVAVGMGVFGLYPALRKLLGDTGYDWAFPLALFYVSGCLILAAAILLRPPRPSSALYAILNTFAVVLSVLMLGRGILGYGPWQKPSVALVERDELEAVAASTPALPDVYQLVFDGFGRPDVLQRMYGLDLSHFVAALREQGFDVDPARGSANYPQTYLSLASMLNVRYVQDVTDRMPDEISREPMHALIQNSTVVRTFKRLGYEFTVIGSIDSTTQRHRLADVCECDYPLVGPFEATVIQHTPIGDIGLLGLDHRPHRNKVKRSLNALDAVGPSSRPRFLLSHVMSPHPPFVLDAAGHDISPARSVSFVDGAVPWPEYRLHYRDQASYIASRLVSTVRHLEEISRQQGRDAVIIIHGDHGPRAFFDVNDAANTDPSESLPVLLAIRWARASRPSDVPVSSLVNVYREFFRRQFGTDLRLLPDRGFVSSFIVPYRFIEAEIR